VDHYYIIESRYTFSGARKEVLYSELYKEQFQPYLPKITFLILEDYTDLDLSFTEWRQKYDHLSSDWMIDKEAWYRENYQREIVLPYLQDATNYVLIVTDCDEIIPTLCIARTSESIFGITERSYFSENGYV